MIPHFAAHNFKFPARLIGFVRFEKRDRQGKSRSQSQRGIKFQRGPKFADRHVVLILLQGVVALAQVGFRSVYSGGRRSGCLPGRG